ncbi:MAG: thioredoxin TrxC [Gemmatimonadetes bacterium]|nr:thioredoxin TrxC [Gemmatimonadota bacterium]
MTDASPDATRSITLRCAFCLTLNRIDAGRADDRPMCGSCERPFLLDRPVKVTDEDFDPLVRETDIPVLVDFYADWCGPCKIMAPVLDDVARERKGEIVVVKVDTDANPVASQKHGIRSIPTLVLFRDGEEAGRAVGAVPADELAALIDAAPTDNEA